MLPPLLLSVAYSLILRNTIVKRQEKEKNEGDKGGKSALKEQKLQ